jgi:hypothetical protein
MGGGSFDMNITGKVLVNLRADDNGNIIDLANIGTTWNNQGATVSNAQTKFGKYSIYGGTSHQYINTASFNSNLGNIGTGDYTLSFWGNWAHNYYYDMAFSLMCTIPDDSLKHDIAWIFSNTDINNQPGYWFQNWASDRNRIS